MRRGAISAALAAALVGSLLFAAAAQAAPALSVTLSRLSNVGTPLTTINRGDEFVSYEAKVQNTGPDSTSPTLSVSFQLPTGLTPVASSGSGWSCDLLTRVCTNPAVVTAGNSYPPLKLSQVWIADSAPDTVTVKATTSGAGALAASAEDSFTFGARLPVGLDVTDAAACTEPTSGTKLQSCREALEKGAKELTQAGGHPWAASASFRVNVRTRPDGVQIPIEDAHAGVSEIPAGAVGSPAAAEAFCDFATLKVDKCPEDAAVGGVFLDLASPGDGDSLEFAPVVYRMAREEGYPASFGFNTPVTSFVVRTKVRSDGDYGITGVIPLVPGAPKFYASSITFCGYGVKKSTSLFEECRKPSVLADKANPKPFVTLGTNCAIGKPLTRFAVDSWIHRGRLAPNGLPDLTDPNWVTLDFHSPALTGCETLTEEWVGQHEPSFGFQPDSHAADSPAAYTAKLHIPQEGLERSDGLATSHLKDTTVTLPAGLSFNPAIGDGLAACSEEQVGLIGTGFPPPSRIHFDTLMPQCPANSKVGLATIQTPLLEETLHGSVYLAAQDENPFGTDYAIYLTVEEPKVGVVFKLAGEVLPDPVTGQITSVFEDNPQLPFDDLELEFFGGGRSALANPATCGTFAVRSAMTPWSAKDPEAPEAGEIARPGDQIEIDSGPNGTACVSDPAQRPFELGLSAGAKQPLAGAKSPFSIRITRPDGAQELSALQISPPPGFVASLRGIPYCSEAQIAAARAASGKAEQGAPSCPAASALGTTNAGAGAGPTPFFAPGKLYLAGPYKGAPLSVVAITPAVAGPFDLGNVVIRSALRIDPTTARITAHTDPIPQILGGVPLRIRDIRIDLDRPAWAQNPTNCEALSVDIVAFGSDGAVSRPSNRFQAEGCERLAFKPDLGIRLFGATRRGAYQRLRATLTARPGDANIARTAVTLPHSEFLAQEHIRTVCTRIQFAARACPPGSIYGRAAATTPLLEQPLSGPVYLRSSANLLPDLVVALKGPDSQPIEIELSGRTDSKNGGIRNTFDVVPDAPVEKFTLELLGGKKSLIVNSRDICKSKNRATVLMNAQNGRVHKFRPVVANPGCRKAKKGEGHKKHARVVR